MTAVMPKRRGGGRRDNAAIEALAKAFAERGIEDGVQVTAFLPGAIMTDRRLSMLEKPQPQRDHIREAKDAVPQASRHRPFRSC